MSLLGLRELRLCSTRSRGLVYDNFRLDIFVREVRDILSFCTLLGLRELRLCSTRSRGLMYDNFRLDIFVREVRDIHPFAHSLVYENYCCDLREVIARCTINLG
jgi:hypothetical protein